MLMKIKVDSVKRCANSQGEIYREEVKTSAVVAGSEANKQWFKGVPWINYEFAIDNPDAMGKLLPGKQYIIELREPREGE
jgi:hypothetical protein